MTFLEHFAELRIRIVRSVIFGFLAFFVCYAYHVEIFDFVSAPIQEGLIKHGIYRFSALSVTEPIIVYLKVSLVAALILTSPFFILQIWMFVAPALKRKERRVVLPVLFFGSFFFLLGVAFCYRVLLPFLTDYLVGIGEETAAVSMDITLQSALSYAILFLLIFGLAFQLPLVIFFLALLGMVGPKKLLNFFRYWIVLAFLIGAVLTPPDPVSQLMMAVPLIVLYLVGVVGSVFAVRMRARAEDDGAAGITAMWTLVGAGLFLILAAGFTWSLWPRPHSHPLLWVNPNQSVIVGMQPSVLERDGLWARAKRDVTLEFPDAGQVLKDKEWKPELIISQSDLRGGSMLIIYDDQVQKRVESGVAKGLEERREGGATVYGTRSALRAEQGDLIVCESRRCAFGSARFVMETVRLYRAEVLGVSDLVDLGEIRQRGPIWGRVQGRAQPVVADAYKIGLPDQFAHVSFWVIQHPNMGRQVHATIAPEEADLLDQLESDIGSLTVLSSGAAVVEEDQGISFTSAHMIPVLADLLRPSKGGSTLFSEQYQLTRPDYRALLKPVLHDKPRASGTSQTNLLSMVRSVGLKLDGVRKENGMISVTWSQGTVGKPAP